MSGGLSGGDVIVGIDSVFVCFSKCVVYLYERAPPPKRYYSPDLFGWWHKLQPEQWRESAIEYEHAALLKGHGRMRVVSRAETGARLASSTRGICSRNHN